MEVLIYGIINSIILSLYSLGFTLVYSISRLPNFAHGALYVTCGYLVCDSLNRRGPALSPLASCLGIGATSRHRGSDLPVYPHPHTRHGDIGDHRHLCCRPGNHSKGSAGGTPGHDLYVFPRFSPGSVSSSRRQRRLSRGSSSSGSASSPSFSFTSLPISTGSALPSGGSRRMSGLP